MVKDISTDKIKAKKISFAEYLFQCSYIREDMLKNIGENENIEKISDLSSIDITLIKLYYRQWEDLDSTDLDLSIYDEVLLTLPRQLCRDHIILPYKIEDNTLHIACKNPNSIAMRKQVIANCSKYKIKYVLVRERIILPLLHVYYRDIEGVLRKTRVVSGDLAFKTGAQKVFDEIIDAIVTDGIAHSATDVHIVKSKKNLSYRLRTHHQFYPVVDLPLSIADGFRNRVLIRGGCAFNRLMQVQDAAIEVIIEKKKVPVRISHIPTEDGYSIVLRIIREEFLDIKEADLTQEQWKSLDYQLQYNKGLVLICGPVGSGKTTFYYGIMKQLCAERMKIISIEEPIESDVDHAFQMDISHSKLTFHDTMKVILRQDPDVVMVGEIRTQDALRCVSESKLSGHMVLSTIHALSPWDCLIKLRRLGYNESQLMNQSLSIVTVRLIPYLCPHCIIDHNLTKYENILLKEAGVDTQVSTWKRSLGCTKCHFLGTSKIAPFYDILTLKPEDMAEVGKNWDNLRDMKILHKTINNLNKDLISLANKGHIDLKTYFTMISI